MFLEFFLGLKLTFGEQFQAQSSICNSRAMRWWDKALKPNMIEINSSQELVDLLLIAGDRLVIVDFYSPGCGGCKTVKSCGKGTKKRCTSFGFRVSNWLLRKEFWNWVSEGVLKCKGFGGS